MSNLAKEAICKVPKTQKKTPPNQNAHHNFNQKRLPRPRPPSKTRKQQHNHPDR